MSLPDDGCLFLRLAQAHSDIKKNQSKSDVMYRVGLASLITGNMTMFL